jgi:hypothetical protein
MQRVVDAQSVIDGAKVNLGILDDIKVYAAKSLQVVHILNLPKHARQSQPEHVEALFRESDAVLFFVRSGDAYPWASLAKEIARAISPEGEPGRLSPGIYHVLASASYEQSAEMLDQLGYPSLTRIATGPQVAAQIKEIGVTSEQVETEGSEGKSTQSANGGAEHVLKPKGESPSTGAVYARSGEAPHTESKHRNESRRARLLSYVVSGTDDNSGRIEDPDISKERDELASRGVERVVAYEKDQGRHPEIMPPLNKGFDVKSKDGDGNVIRLIEVKSISGDWGDQGVGVTKAQFEFSRDSSEMSWLYVVERAFDDSNHMIYAINNPARQVTRFMYDKGWKAVAEDTTIDQQLPSESK